jgi:hypothetical protein
MSVPKLIEFVGGCLSHSLAPRLSLFGNRRLMFGVSGFCRRLEALFVGVSSRASQPLRCAES